MKKILLLVVLLSVFSLSLFAQQHLIQFKNGVPNDFSTQVKALGGTVIYAHPIMALVSGLSDSAAATLGKGAGIADIQPDATFVLDDVTGPNDIADVSATSATNPAGAYFYARQWNMRAIGANYAWAAGKFGSPSTTVAVIDSGIDYTNPDLNGHVDLSRSVSFQPAEDAVVDANFPGKNHITDIYFHGTHVSNTIVSNANTVAGVTSNVTLIGIKALAYNPSTGSASGSLGAVLSGVLWAADHGADVANMSLGGGFAKAGNGRYIGLINKTFNYAHQKGTLIVVSAGNSAIDLDHDGNFLSTYCDTPNVVCVSATGPTSQVSTNGPWIDVDAAAYYTNYGRSAIDVAAPGGNGTPSLGKYTYVYQVCSQTSMYIPQCRTGNYIIGSQGTSMAAPHVSGLAALLVDQIGHGHPSQLKARLLQGADDLGLPGVDPFYGKGRINVPKTLGLPY
jgi:subtilisin family serine protease